MCGGRGAKYPNDCTALYHCFLSPRCTHILRRLTWLADSSTRLAAAAMETSAPLVTLLPLLLPIPPPVEVVVAEVRGRAALAGAASADIRHG
jgi:hypothetical protein